MKDNPGNPYEELSQIVFQSILSQGDLPNVAVQHNVTLRGKHTNHQIDVYWKFEVGGIQYETIVQAKDWKNPVNQGELLKFKGVLDDLPGQPKGIFVTRTGYQSGAKEWAFAHGILLYELKEFEPPPLSGMVRGGWATFKLISMPLHATIKTGDEQIEGNNFFVWGIECDFCNPTVANIKFDVSSSWLKQEYPAKDLSESKQFEFPPGTTFSDVNLFNQEGAVIRTFWDLVCEYARTMKEENIDQKQLTHAFTEPTFVQVMSPVPCLKISAVSMNIEIRHTRETRRLKMSNFAQWILHELNSDKCHWFAATPSVTAKLPNKDDD
jgi:hypothetical protein